MTTMWVWLTDDSIQRLTGATTRTLHPSVDAAIAEILRLRGLNGQALGFTVTDERDDELVILRLEYPDEAACLEAYDFVGIRRKVKVKLPNRTADVEIMALR